jgi:hypothetical protein
MAGNGAGEPAVTPLDAGLLRTIRGPAAELAELEDEFARQLQYDLATLIPDLAGLRTDDGWVFCHRMVRVLLWAAGADRPAAVTASALRQVGGTNWQEGFPETHYVSLAHALVRTVRDLLGDEWSTSQGSAWISFFQWAAPHLVAGSRQAAAHAAAQQAAQQAAAQQLAAQQLAAEQAAAEQLAAQQAAHWAAQQVGSQPGVVPPAPVPPAAQQAPGPAGPGQAAPGQPVSGQPAHDQAAYGQPVSGQPVSGQPVSGQPVSQQPGAWPPPRPRDLRVARRQPAPGEADLEQVADLLGYEDEEDEEDEEMGYGQIMLSMTRNPRRGRPQRSG